MNKLLSLQILRAVAAWLVVLHHYHQFFHNMDDSPGLWHFAGAVGTYAVFVFFVISGFIMQRSLAQRPVSALSFLARRVERIVPAYWVATLCLILAASVVGLGPLNWGAWTLQSLLLSLAFVPHQHPAGLGLFPTLVVGWSLNFEMFFYALLALMLGLFRRAWLWPTLGVLCVLPLVWGPQWWLASIASSPLLILFAVGLLAGQWLALPAQNQRRRSVLLLAVAIAGVTVAYLATYPWPVVWQFSGAFKMFLACAMVLSALLCNNWVSRLPGASFLVRLGDYSYSTYLWHPVVLVLLHAIAWRPAGGMPEWLWFTAYVLLVYVLSFISYRYVESIRFVGKRRVLGRSAS